MLLTKPMKITSFDYLTQGKNLRVAIQADLDEENQGHAQSVTLADGQEIPAAQYYKQMHLEEKTELLFDPAKFPTQRMMAERFAPSAMSYASALAAGNPRITWKNDDKQLEGGIPEKVVRFFSPCPGAAGLGKAKGKWESEDVTYPCQGTKVLGRVVWSLL